MHMRLMDNHYHLLIETPKANISQILQNINTSYTVYINRETSEERAFNAGAIQRDNSG